MSGAYIAWIPGTGPFLETQELHFDAVTSETFTSSVTATTHPVETGADITDNLRPNLQTASLSVFVSNTPIQGRGGVVTSVSIPAIQFQPSFTLTPGAVFGAIGGAISNLFSGEKDPVNAQVLSFESEIYPITDTLNKLMELKDSGQLVSILSSSFQVDNLAIVGVTPSKTPQDGTGITIDIEFQQIRVVDTKLVKFVPPPVTVKKPVVPPKEEKGEQPPKVPVSSIKDYVNKSPRLAARIGLGPT